MSGEPRDLIATASETVGPFFHFGLATDLSLGVIADRSALGEHITLRVTVTDGDAAPVPDGLIELWQVDAGGAAASPPGPGSPPLPFRGFGRLATGADGGCEFKTVRPGPAIGGQEPGQAAHINVCLFARGLLRHLYTRIYFDGDPGLGADPVLALVPPARRDTLLARPDPAQPHSWRFDIRLQGQGETVFFDL